MTVSERNAAYDIEAVLSSWRGIERGKVCSEGLAQVSCGIGGVKAVLGFELTRFKIPLLLALCQLESLGAIIDLVHLNIHLVHVRRYPLPLHRLDSGHLALRLDDYSGEEGSDEPPADVAVFLQH